MNWYKDRDKFSSNERVILSILTTNEDPSKIWISYNDAHAMSNLRLDIFNIAVQSLIHQGIIRLGDQGNGMTLALEEKIDQMKYDKLEEVLSEIEDEIQDALENEDYDMANDLQKIIDEKRNGDSKQ